MNLETVSNVYPNGLPAASELDLDVAEGKLMVLVRPSGSGKTTALRMVTDLGGHHLRDALDRREGGQQPAPQGPQGGQRLGTSDSWEHGFHQDFPIPTKLPSPRCQWTAGIPRGRTGILQVGGQQFSKWADRNSPSGRPGRRPLQLVLLGTGARSQLAGATTGCLSGDVLGHSCPPASPGSLSARR